MNLISDLIEKKLKEKNIKVFRNDYLSSYKNILNECEDNNINLLVSLETTSSDNHDKTGIQTIITNSSANSYGLANIINNKLNSIKESNLIYSNNIKGSLTNEKDSMLSLMLELGYHDNENDAKFIINNRENIANIVASSILDYYGIH
jgi:N-acetylmuramoyl-L-alanine amidase